jgi:hypothetical protein
MGDAICAWFGQKTVGRMVASMKGNQWWWWWRLVINDNQIGVGEGRQKRWITSITTTNERAGIRAYWGCTLIDWKWRDWNDATNLLWDEIRGQGWDEIRQPPPVKDNGRTHTTTNQKHV